MDYILIEYPYLLVRPLGLGERGLVYRVDPRETEEYNTSVHLQTGTTDYLILKVEIKYFVTQNLVGVDIQSVH